MKPRAALLAAFAFAAGPLTFPVHAEIDAQLAVEIASDAPLDVWLLAGQSNILGMLANRPRPIESDPRVLYLGVDSRWRVAAEPLDRYCFPHGDAHGLILREGLTDNPRNTNKGAGPTIFFGSHLAKAIDRPVGIIGVSTGGTIKKKWEPNLSDNGQSFYEQLLTHIRTAKRPLKGVVWYQGESDVLWDPTDADYYEEGLTNLINALRRDLKQPQLPIIIVQIARHIPQYFAGQDGKSYTGAVVNDELATYTRAWDTVQEAQRRVADEMDHVSIVATLDLHPMADAIHLDMDAMQRLGRRIGEVALSDVYDQSDHGRTIRIREINVEGDIVTVRFDGVTGKLESDGRPTGFEIRYPDATPEQTVGQLKTAISNVSLSTKEPNAIKLQIVGGLHSDWSPVLYYGAGMDPYCNITDSADIAIPKFGPLSIPYEKILPPRE